MAVAELANRDFGTHVERRVNRNPQRVERGVIVGQSGRAAWPLVWWEFATEPVSEDPAGLKQARSWFPRRPENA